MSQAAVLSRIWQLSSSGSAQSSGAHTHSISFAAKSSIAVESFSLLRALNVIRSCATKTTGMGQSMTMPPQPRKALGSHS